MAEKGPLVAVKGPLVAVKGPEVAMLFARSGSEGLQGCGNTVSAVALGKYTTLCLLPSKQ